MGNFVTISIEVELAWGRHDVGGWAICSADRSAEEHYLQRLLEICDAVGVPITFDVVGHLLLSECSGMHEGGHAPGWFEADPGTSAREHPLFYWPEVVDLIMGREVNHEIATHTFSHVLCDEISDDTLAWEIEKCVELHERAGLEAPVSVVTPRHRSVSYGVLRNAEIKILRKPKTQARKSSIGEALDRGYTLATGHPAFLLQERLGIIETYTTPYPSLAAAHLPYGQHAPMQGFQYVPRGVRKHLHRTYLDSALTAARDGEGHAHLWSHLYNIANEPQWSCIKPFLKKAGTLQENGDLEVLTMADLIDRY